MLELAYEHPRTGEPEHICQAVRVARDQPFELKIGRRAELVCWGAVLPPQAIALCRDTGLATLHRAPGPTRTDRLRSGIGMNLHTIRRLKPLKVGDPIAAGRSVGNFRHPPVAVAPSLPLVTVT